MGTVGNQRFMRVFVREFRETERGRERIYLENAPKCPNSFFLIWGFWGIYTNFVTLQLLGAFPSPAALKGAPGLVSVDKNCLFSVLISIAYLKAFPYFD